MSPASAKLGGLLELRRHPEVVDLDRAYLPIGVRGFGRGIFDYPGTRGADLGKLRFFRLEPDRLIVSNIKGWEGAVAVTGQDEEGRIASNRFLTYAGDSARVDLAYIKHWLLSDDGLQALGRASPGSADRNRTLSMKNFEAIEVPLPGLTEQRRIAAHLDRLALIASMNQGAMPHRRALSRAVKNSIVQEAGGRRHELGDLLTMRAGEPVLDDVRYRMTGVYSFGRGLLNRGVIAGSETKYKTLTTLRTGNVVYSKLGAFENAVAVVNEGFERSFVSPEFPVFEVCEGVNPDFLRAALTTSHFAEALGAATSGVGARQKRVSPPAFLGLKIQVPDRRVQVRVAEMLRIAERSDLLMRSASTLAGALVPAARNGVFSALR